MEQARCSCCERLLPIEKFSKDSHDIRGRKSHCKFCRNWSNRKIKGDSKDYTHLEDDPCHICGILNTSSFMAIDHCHKTGLVRGRLCMFCNTALGKFKDNIDFLNKAIEYLKRHKK